MITITGAENGFYRLFNFSLLIGLTLFIVSGTSSQAAESVNLINGSFEEPYITSGRWDKNSDEIPGWTSNMPIEFYHDDVYDIDVVNPIEGGRQFIDLASPDSEFYSIKQTISTTPGQSYELQFYNQRGVIRVRAGGQELGAFNSTNYAWKSHAVLFTASSNRTEIEFYAYNDDALTNETGNLLDEISIHINDNIAPNITNITRFIPSVESTDADNVTFQVTFSEAVNHVDLSDFNMIVSNTVRAQLKSVTQISRQVYNIELEQVAGNGDLAIVLSDSHNIADDAGNIGLTSINSRAQYAIFNDETPPQLLTIKRHLPVDEFTNADSVVFDVEFSEAVSNVDTSDFEFDNQGTLTATLGSVVQQAENQYHIQVDSIQGDGVLGVDIRTDSDITDIAGNLISITHR